MTSNPRRVPTSFRDLTDTECYAILARNQIGRLAFTFRDRVDVQPLNYVMIGNDLVFRTSAGSKIDVLSHHPWVAFEVDEIDGSVAWYSVVVRGTIYPVEDVGNADERAAYAEALHKLGLTERTVAEQPGTMLLRLHAENVTGREARVGELPTRRPGSTGT